MVVLFTDTSNDAFNVVQSISVFPKNWLHSTYIMNIAIKIVNFTVVHPLTLAKAKILFCTQWFSFQKLTRYTSVRDLYTTESYTSTQDNVDFQTESWRARALLECFGRPSERVIPRPLRTHTWTYAWWIQRIKNSNPLAILHTLQFFLPEYHETIVCFVGRVDPASRKLLRAERNHEEIFG